jgi:hypothetical protein
MNIRLVGAALLLLSTLSLSPIAEAQTGGVSTTFRVSGQVDTSNNRVLAG